MERSEIKAIVENILLVADEPVTSKRLAATIINEMPSSVFESILDELKEEYSDRNLQIIEVAEGFLIATRKEYSDWIRKFYNSDKTARLTQPALDTLSIIAYKQPITKPEIEEIRGVDSSGVVKTLLEKKIITPAGRKQVLGRPMMYKTTQRFLEYFGLKDLGDLPTLEDLKEVSLSGSQDENFEQQTRMVFENPIDVSDELSLKSPQGIANTKISDQKVEEGTKEIIVKEQVDVKNKIPVPEDSIQEKPEPN